MASQPQAANWLAKNGPKELELLFRAIVYHPSTPILIADNDGAPIDASAGAGKLLGLPREKIIGRPIEEFTPPAAKPEASQLWRAFLERGEQEGTLQLMGADGLPAEVEFTAKANVLPLRHAVVLRPKLGAAHALEANADRAPSWVRDYALYLVDVEGCVAAWYSGAERIYGYQHDEASIPTKTPSVSTYRRISNGLRWKATWARKAGRRERAERNSGPTPSRWRSRTSAGNYKGSLEWCAISASGTEGMRSYAIAGLGYGRFQCTPPSPEWFPASSTGFSKLTTHFLR
jgi:PAS domain S-box-containing protein